MQTRNELIIVGGGLSGCEAAWQAAERGHLVRLFEMRPSRMTPAHTSDRLAELVCSNSFGSSLPDRASGLLQNELDLLCRDIFPGNIPSLVLSTARRFALPAGSALAVDRQDFSQAVTSAIQHHPNIEVIRQEVSRIPPVPCIIASGPLTSPSFTTAIQEIAGHENLFFFDAIAPSVYAESIDMTIAFRASRFLRGETQAGDYINCPMDKQQYFEFIQALTTACKAPLHAFDIQEQASAASYFEGCLPIEELASRGPTSLAYGPMRPTGLLNPHTGRPAYAIVQLRQDNQAGSLFNLVGFQTNLAYAEQKRVLSMIPGLEHAEFARYGQMHRNTYIASPLLLDSHLQMRRFPGLFFAGQITGIEGYLGNIASGWLAGVNASRWMEGLPLLELPLESLLGAMVNYLTRAEMKDFKPIKAIFGILPPLDNPLHARRDRAGQYANRSLACLESWISAL